MDILTKDMMKMGKKLILLAMAVAALAAMAVPAAASAEMTLKDAAGKVQPKQWIVGTSIDTITTNTPVGTLECPHIEVAAEVVTNSGTLITGANAAVTPPTECLAEGLPLTVTKPSLTHIETNGVNDEGKASLSFEADVGGFACPYGGTVRFTYNTGPGNDTLTLTGPLTSTFAFCEPEEPPVVFHGTYTLTTTNGEPVWVEPGA